MKLQRLKIHLNIILEYYLLTFYLALTVDFFSAIFILWFKYMQHS